MTSIPAENPYLNQINQTLPRLLALYDIDRTSSSYGMGDRFFWAWNLIDFGNASYQGACHGITRLWKCGLWPYPTSKDKFISRIDGMFLGTNKLTRKDGSLEEAFPNEGSYCVTALVAFDLICTMDLLSEDVSDVTLGKWRDIIEPLVGYLIKADETHAIISNHLATAAAALFRWHLETGDASSEIKAKSLLNRILDNQSKEGWFLEYEGADPGYQTLGTYYLSDIHIIRPDLKILEALSRSIKFLWHFAHPDGSFGGVYGSRSTRFYCPAGMEVLAEHIPEAKTLATYMAASINAQKVVTLSCMDEPNLIPMFNAYCLAATYWDRNRQSQVSSVVPALELDPKRFVFPESGLVVDRGSSHYSILSIHKGGVVIHFRKGRAVQQDTGVVVRSGKGRIGSSQSYCRSNEYSITGEEIRITSNIMQMPKRLPTPTEFIVLRILCVTLFKNRWLRESVKRLLVRTLITNPKEMGASNTRIISLGKSLSVADNLNLPAGYEEVKNCNRFISIHMASQGYWQLQDEID